MNSSMVSLSQVFVMQPCMPCGGSRLISLSIVSPLLFGEVGVNDVTLFALLRGILVGCCNPLMRHGQKLVVTEWQLTLWSSVRLKLDGRWML